MGLILPYSYANEIPYCVLVNKLVPAHPKTDLQNLMTSLNVYRILFEVWKEGKAKIKEEHPNNIEEIDGQVLSHFIQLTQENSMHSFFRFDYLKVTASTDKYSLDLKSKSIQTDFHFSNCRFESGIDFSFGSFRDFEFTDCYFGVSKNEERHFLKNSIKLRPALNGEQSLFSGSLCISNIHPIELYTSSKEFNFNLIKLIEKNENNVGVNGDLYFPKTKIEGQLKIEGIKIFNESNSEMCLDHSYISFLNINFLYSKSLSFSCYHLKGREIRIKNSFIRTKSYQFLSSIKYNDGSDVSILNNLSENSNINFKYLECEVFLFSNSIIYGKCILDFSNITKRTNIENSFFISNIFSGKIDNASSLNLGEIQSLEINKKNVIDIDKRIDNLFSSLSICHSTHRVVGIFKKIISLGQVNLTGLHAESLHLYMSYFISPIKNTTALKISKMTINRSVYFNTINRFKYNHDFENIDKLLNGIEEHFPDFKDSLYSSFQGFITKKRKSIDYIVKNCCIENNSGSQYKDRDSWINRYTLVIGSMDCRNTSIGDSLDLAGLFMCGIYPFKNEYSFKIWNTYVGKNLFVNTPSKVYYIPGFKIAGNMSFKGSFCRTFFFDKSLHSYPKDTNCIAHLDDLVGGISEKPCLDFHLFNYEEIISDRPSGLSNNDNIRDLSWLYNSSDDIENQSFAFEQYARTLMKNGNDDIGIKTILFGKFFTGQLRTKWGQELLRWLKSKIG